jgi:hypothetical protein
MSIETMELYEKLSVISAITSCTINGLIDSDEAGKLIIKIIHSIVNENDIP